MNAHSLRRAALVVFAAAAIGGLAPRAATATDAPAQDCCVYPTLPAHARSIDGFVPPGWSIELLARGILDEGQHPAVALVLHRQGTAEPPETLPRILVVAFANPDGSYDLVLQNQTLIPRLTPADAEHWYSYTLGRPRKASIPPLDQPGLDFHRGALRIRLYGAYQIGEATDDDQTYTFRFIGGKLMLIGYDSVVIGMRPDTANWSIDFLTRRISFTLGVSCAGREDVVAHCHARPAEWKPLKPAPLLSIEQIGNGVLDFKPQELWPRNW